jgi:hypothetical protein
MTSIPAARARLRRTTALLAAIAAVSLLGACGDDPVSTNPIAGTYTATTFMVTPEGTTAPIDLKAGGATLTISIAEDNSTTGQLVVPKALTGEATDFVASMAGTVTSSGGGVVFHQTADTFVRDLTWTVSGRTISVSNQVLTGDSYTITLSR